MLSSTSISFVVIYAQTCKHVYNFGILEQRSRIKRTYFLLINLAIADLLVGITELTVLGAFKSEVMLKSEIVHSPLEDTSVVSSAVMTTLMRV